jgi:hypothetical protein
MARQQTLQIGIRLAPDLRRAFINKAAPHGGTSEVLRELIQAYVENRITGIIPKPSKEIL